MTDKTHIDSSMPFAEYVRIDGINATSLKAGINESPLAMHYRMTGDDEDRDTEEKHKGSLAHIAILEPEAFASKVSVFPGPITAKTRATNAYKDFAAEHELPVLPDELPALMELPGAVHANRFAHDLLSRTEHEVSLFWHDSLYGQAKARLDGLDSRVGIVELKTTTVWPRRVVRDDGTTEVDLFRLTRLANGLNYHVQLGWYWLGASTFHGEQLPVHVVWVKQRKPFDVIVQRVPTPVLKEGADLAMRMAKYYRACEASGQFPGVCDDVVEYERPTWAKEEGWKVGEEDD